jgi:predicted XRE-type DNA-binding protein
MRTRSEKKNVPRRIKIEEGSGNVFADIGIPNPEESLAKADVAREIIRIISERKLTQVEAAELLGIGQPRVSELKRGRLSVFSLEKLIEFAKALGNEVEILVKSAPEPHLRVRIGGALLPTPANVRVSTCEYVYGSGVCQITTGPAGLVVSNVGEALNIEGAYWARVRSKTCTFLGLPLSSEGTVAPHLAWLFSQKEGQHQ